MKTRVYIADCTDPYRNLAAEELLLRRAKPGEVVLYLWQNNHTIVIGRNQNAWKECDVAAFERDGGSLARRLSGGGAVYHDMGNQNFTFLAGAQDYDLEKQTEVIRLAARKFGIEAVRSGRNDILALAPGETVEQGRKFSGNAFYQSGGQCYHHGTVLVDSDMGLLGRYLNPSPEKLAGKGVTSVRARVVNLKELAPDITTGSMRGALVEAMAQVYGPKPEWFDDRELPRREWDALTEKYASRQWRLGEPFPYTARFAARLSFGEVEVQLQVKEGRVQTAKIYSDAMDADWVEAMGAGLQGAGFQGEALLTRVLGTAGPQDWARELANWLAGSMTDFAGENHSV